MRFNFRKQQGNTGILIKQKTENQLVAAAGDGLSSSYAENNTYNLEIVAVTFYIMNKLKW